MTPNRPACERLMVLRLARCRPMRGLVWLWLTAAIGLSSSASAADFACAAGDIPCLVDAITTANANGEANTLTLSAGVYAFTTPDNLDEEGRNGLPSLTGALAIRGAAAGTILEREPTAPSFRLLHVGATGVLTLDGLVIQGFRDESSGGAAALNRGMLTIVNSTITGNTTSVPGDSGVRGGAIWNEGTLIIDHSSVTHNLNRGQIAKGGGIFNGGTLIIEHSAITDNVNLNGPGGGIYNSGSLVIVNSTVARNRCGSGFPSGQCLDSGGIANCSAAIFGGPPCVPAGISNVTPSLVIRNTTVLDNSGGIANTDGTVWLQNTIVAHNGGRPDCSGVITSLDNNIVGDITSCLIALEAGDIIGDPLVGEFSDDGIPGSGHFPLMAGSPAIDAGNDEACSPTDQLERPRAGRCDIGAIEFQPPIPEVEEVAIAIRPRGTENRINLHKGGEVRVAILSSESFDATGVDTTTIRFGATGTEASALHVAYRDVDGDGDTDLVSVFDVFHTGIQCGGKWATLTAGTLGGRLLRGSDRITTVRCQ